MWHAGKNSGSQISPLCSKAVTDDSTGKSVPAQVIPLDERTLGIPLLYINYYGLSKQDIADKVHDYENKATHNRFLSKWEPAAGRPGKAVGGPGGLPGVGNP